MRNACVFVVILFFIHIAIAKRFETRCKLVRELIKVGLPNDIFLGQWVCLIEKVSNRDTSALVVTPSGKKYYGLYQIPSRWCREKRRGGDCDITCELMTNLSSVVILGKLEWKYIKVALLDDDVRDDTICATKIFQTEGLKYWQKWTARCKNDNFITNEIYKCPDLNRSSPERSISSNGYHPYRRPTLSRSKRNLNAMKLKQIIERTSI